MPCGTRSAHHPHGVTWAGVLLLALLSAAPSAGWAQQGSTPAAAAAPALTGVVRTATGELLPGATVFVRGTFVGTSTDGAGRFRFTVPGAKAGQPIELSVSYVGYESQTLSITPGTAELSVNLVASPTMLDETVVAASRVEQTLAEAPVTIEKVTSVQINRISTPDVMAGLAALKSVDVSSSALLVSAISTRGFNSAKSERVIQLTDYVDTQSPSLNVNAGNMLGVPEVDLESIDVLHGASSALYGANAFNGVVLFNSRDPFVYEGLTARVRGGSRGYLDGQVRLARKFTPRLAAKLTLSYVQANDFLPTNFEAQEKLYEPTNNLSGSVFGYNAVNRYGDANPNPAGSSLALTQTVRDPQTNQNAVYNVYMPGFTEQELVADDNRTYGVRVQPTISYLLSDNLKATAGYRFWRGTTTYQSSSRYRFKNLENQQFFTELKSDKFFVRAYTTGDDGGDTYDMNFLGAFLQNQLVAGDSRNRTYGNVFAETYRSKFVEARQQIAQENPSFTLAQTQQLALPIAYAAAAATQLQPGTAAFNEARARIVTDSSPGKGAHIRPQSRLSDISAQYQFKLPAETGLIVGGAYRAFRLGSDGRLFSDTTGTRLQNHEYGAYAQLTKGFMQNRLKLAFAARTDFFKNFDPAFSPRASVTYALGRDLQHNFRASFSRAFRSPAQLDQYINLDLVRAYLLGNVGNGFQGIDLVKFRANLGATDSALASYRISIPALRLEEVNTLELGYRAALTEKLSLDFNVYSSRYSRFIGTRRFIGNVDGSLPTNDQLRVGSGNSFATPGAATRVIQAWTNADQDLSTRGASLGVNYALSQAVALMATYSYNKLTTTDLPADFQTFFNTPKHKFTLGASGTIATDFSYNLTYRWADSFRFEMPFAAGQLDAPSALDVNFGYRLARLNTTFQLGGTNILDTNNTQVYGAPSMGRIMYAGVLVDIK